MSRLSRLLSLSYLVLNSALSKLEYSDKLVRVEHDAEGGADGSGREVLGEVSSHVAVVTVAVNNSAPNAFIVGTSLCVLGFVDVGNALAVIENAGFAVLASLDLEESLSLMLSSLTSLEAQESALDVKSKSNVIFAKFIIIVHKKVRCLHKKMSNKIIILSIKLRE